MYVLRFDVIFLFNSAYDEIAANPTVEQTIRVGSADVEMVVQAANNQM